MAGVLFVVCIPREKYEKYLSSGRQSSEDDVQDVRKKSYESISSLSIQGPSSFNSNPDEDRVPPLKFTDDNEPPTVVEPSKDDLPSTSKGIRGSRESILSEIDKICAEREQFNKENEEAVEKFFNTSVVDILTKKNCMERVMREIIHRMQIRNVSWQKVNGGNSYKVSFSVEKGVRCDDTIHLLSKFGIGEKKGSSCVIIPCSVYKDKSHIKRCDDSTEEPFKETSWNRLIGNVRARLNVEKLVYAVKSEASLSFDFVILLIVAASVASFGLVENSPLILIASMLISPLMGPVICATFACVIKDRKLQFWGLRNEIIGILLCILVGFFFGLIVCVLDYIFNIQIILTKEMLSRCTWHSVIVGVFIALLSGAAQSIALLRENFGSLVGVAISASLLPPAVNTGLLWSFSCISQIFRLLTIQAFESISIDNLVYSDDSAMELLILGSISLFLTITNVICVYFMGYIFLCIKIEVAPSTDEERQFWKHDVPIARDYNKTLNADDGKKLREQLKQYRHEEVNENFKGVAAELLKQEFYPATRTWSPLMHKFQARNEQPRTSIIDFNAFCKSMTCESENANKSPRSKSFSFKRSDPIPTPNVSASSHNEDSSCEPIKRHITIVDIESSSNEDDRKGYKKFIVNPANDEFMSIKI